MKKNGKIILLAGVLSLCLLLTACYQPPDDVNINNPTGGENNLPFLTLAPTPTVTVTPDTVVVETQNIFGPDGGIQTPTPTPPDGGGNGLCG